jgi:hypothetical protein
MNLCAGIHALGLYCYGHDTMHVSLGGVSLVQQDDCQPKVHDGIVFNIVPIYLPQGFFEFEYSLRSSSDTTYMMAAVLNDTIPGQLRGLISFQHEALYLPSAVNLMIENVGRYTGSIASNNTVTVVNVQHA